MNSNPRTIAQGPDPALDPNPVVTWALSEVAQGRIDNLRRVIDAMPLNDPAAIITAVNTLEAVKESSAPKVGWQRKAA